jgi:transcriptional regulator with XRE-family HTH domain
MKKKESIRTTDRQRVGKSIADLRRLRGVSQYRLSDLTGIARSHIGSIERGEFSVGIDTLSIIASALGAEIDFIIKN